AAGAVAAPQSACDAWKGTSRWCLQFVSGSAEEVDDAEEQDPDDVHEVPVVADDVGADGLLVRVRAGHVGTRDHEEEGDEAAEDVDAVEAGGEEEHGPVHVGGDEVALTEQREVLPHLAADEDGAEDEG